MTLVRIQINEARSSGCTILEQAGAPPAVAKQVVSELIENDLVGYPSHGLMRIPAYVEEIRCRALNPMSRPRIEVAENDVVRIHGRRAFGVLAADALVRAFAKNSESKAISLGFLDQAHHIGRLARIGRQAATEHGLVTIGFCNYLGHGRRVAPPGGKAARLCTNPLLIAIPSQPDPVVVDMSTSVVSEGFVRNAFEKKQSLEVGILQDSEGNPVTDPALLYTDPPQATMCAMSGHKGYVLALAIELLVGALGGCGNVSSPQSPGNGGVFISINPRLSNKNSDQFASTVDAILSFCQIGSQLPAAIRYPGQGYKNTLFKMSQRGYIEYSSSAWHKFSDLMT